MRFRCPFNMMLGPGSTPACIQTWPRFLEGLADWHRCPLFDDQVAGELRKRILELYDEALSKDGRSISYSKLAGSPAYAAYREATEELQRVSHLTQFPASRHLLLRNQMPRINDSEAAFFFGPWRMFIVHLFGATDLLDVI
jgi:hypothetical protein